MDQDKHDGAVDDERKSAPRPRPSAEDQGASEEEQSAQSQETDDIKIDQEWILRDTRATGKETLADLTPRFKLIFLTVVTITILSLLLNAVLVLVRRDDDGARTFIETCSTTFKLGFGAIVGLVGGRVA